MQLSIVVPTFNESARIAATLEPLQLMRARGVEVIVVDGGSSDTTVERARPYADQAVASAKGRAAQMNAGAEIARAEVILFLHADSTLPSEADVHILKSIRAGFEWGRFDVHIIGRHRMLPVIAWFMNHRSRLTGIATGDQGLFVTRQAFALIGGFPDQPLMEDIALCARLLRRSQPDCLDARIRTSGRRWETHGVWRTIVLMWRLRFQYYLGADPVKLHRIYYGHSIGH